MNDIEKMKAGMWYDANNNPELVKLRYECYDLCGTLNRMSFLHPDRSDQIIRILGYCPENLELLSPFYCDYGTNIKLGKNVFINFNNYFMDGAPITIGDNVFIGPSCGFYTANHPLNYHERNKGIEQAKEITVGADCWIGANVAIMPGVTIGRGCVIAAGAVVTRDVPDNCLVGGIPAAIIKTITDQ